MNIDEFVEQVLSHCTETDYDGNIEYYFDGANNTFKVIYKLEDLQEYLLSKGFTQEQLDSEEPAYDNLDYETLDNAKLMELFKDMYQEYVEDLEDEEDE